MLRVLVPTDGSANSHHGIRHVISEYRKNRDLEVHVLNVQAPFSKHICDFSSKSDRAELHQEQAALALAPARQALDDAGVPYSVHVEVGDKADCIADMARRLWNESHRAWVPLGPEDPNLRLVRFVPHSAEFWDTGSESMVRYLFEAVRTETSKRGREAAKEAGSTDEAYGRTNLAPW